LLLASWNDKTSGVRAIGTGKFSKISRLEPGGNK